MKISWTPVWARNSSVYSINGVFARGSRHWKKKKIGSEKIESNGETGKCPTRGRSSVNGAKRVSKESAST